MHLKNKNYGKVKLYNIYRLEMIVRLQKIILLCVSV